MKPRWASAGPRLAVWAAVVAAVAGIVASVQGWPDLTTHMRDDAWYEFAWAFNLAHGNGPTVSDGATTSGVQYLWSLLLVPFAALGLGSLPDIAVILGVLCHLLAALSWWWAGRWTQGSLCVALLWLGNPLLLRECQNGQETALACLCAAMLWHARRASERVFGATALAAMLARSDLLAAVLLLSLVRHGRVWWRGLVVPSFVLAVHLGLNRALGGGWLQDSGMPMAWLRHANFALLAPTTAEWLQQAWWYARPALLGGPFELATAWGIGAALFVAERRFWPRRFRFAPLAAVACGAGLGLANLTVLWITAGLIALVPGGQRRRSVPRLLSALGLGLALVIVLHWAVRWYPRDYYATVLVVFACAGLMQLRRSWWLLGLVAMAEAATAHRIPLEPLQGQERMRLAGDFLAQVAPPGQRIGCFNSGYITYAQRLSGPRIVNLDGVVDARPLVALRRGDLAGWLDAQQIRLLLDAPVQFATDPRIPHASGRWIAQGFDADRDLVELARFVVPGLGPLLGGDSMRLYWRRSAGEVPVLPALARRLGDVRGNAVLAWPARRGSVLEMARKDGSRRELVSADADTLVVVEVPLEPNDTGMVFERGAAAPFEFAGTGSR